MSFASDFKVGIRQALGAQKSNILQLVGRIGVLHVSIGLFAGAALGWGITPRLPFRVFSVFRD